MSEVKVNKLSPRSGTAVTLGDSGDTFTIPSGATLAIAGSVTGFTSAGIDDNATSVAITIDSNENVGIGTTSPNNYSGYGNLTLGGTSGGIFDLEVNGTRTGSLLGLVGETRLASITNIPVTFQVNNAEKMRLTSTGLGIGTSNPSGILECSSLGNTQVYITAGNSSASELFFGDTADVDVGKVTYLHASNAMKFQTNTSEAMRIDSSGNVGIGESSPLGKLHVKTGESSSSVHSSANELIVEGSANTGISILSGNSNEGAIYFGDDGNNDVGRIRYLHNTNQMDFTTNGGIRASINSSGQVGIGTSSPSVTLDVNSSSQTTLLKLTSTAGTSSAMTFANTGSNDSIAISSENDDLKLRTDDGNILFAVAENTEKVRITSAGRIGINDSSPDCMLNIGANSGLANGDRMRIEDGTYKLDIGVGATSFIGTIGASAIKFSTNSSERVRITSAGLVGIGTTSPDGILHLDNGTNTKLVLEKDGGGYASLTFHNDGTSTSYIQLDASEDMVHYGGSGVNQIFYSSGSERMRIVGNTVMVGKTSAGGSTNGVELKTNDESRFTQTSRAVIAINRLTDDGSLVDFKQDGTTNGQIGVRGNTLHIGSDDVGLEFHRNDNTIYPNNPSTNSLRDNSISLGGSSYRFLNLYLSSGVYLGGTGSANKLDDYEQGTWTPTAISTSDWSGFVHTNMNVYMAQYTKVGRKVTIMAGITFPDSGSSALSAGDAIQLSGLPFSIGGSGTDDVYGAIPAQVFLRDSTNGGIAHANINYLDRIALRVVATHGSGARYQSGVRLSCTYFTD